MRFFLPKIIILLICLPGILVSCAWDRLDPASNSTIKLRWNKQLPSDSKSNLETGLVWAFSYVGAQLKPGQLKHSLHWNSDNSFSLNVGELGFPPSVIPKINQLIAFAKSDLAYRQSGEMDFGHFLQFTTQSTWHNYALTEAPSSINEIIQKKKRKGFWFHFDLSHSSISAGQRRIWFNVPQSVDEILFLSQEGSGSLVDGSFQIRSQEVIDVMPNGQLRFLIYDGMGNLKPAADTLLSIAGKPGKCQWCHEKHLLPLFLPSDDFEGAITRAEFLTYVQQAQELIDAFRKNLSTDIQFTNAQDHQWAELLHIGYEEPSLFRIGQEWKMDTLSVKAKLNSLKTHQNSEHPWLGNLYRRTEVQVFDPNPGILVPESSFELREFEPDIFKLRK